MKLIINQCPQCGNHLDLIKEINKCDACGSNIQVIKSSEFTDYEQFIKGLDEHTKRKYVNFHEIIKVAISSGNYNEAYNFCNKVLSLNSNDFIAWENKALSCMFLRTMNDIAESEGLEPLTYLNKAMELNPVKGSLKGTKDTIAYYLFYIAQRYMYNIPPKENFKTGGGYLLTDIDTGITCLWMYHKAFELSNDVKYLKQAVDELTPIKDAKFKWTNDILDKPKRYPVEKMKNTFIELIQKIESEYKPPKKPSFLGL